MNRTERRAAIMAEVRAGTTTLTQGARTLGCKRDYLARGIWRQVKAEAIARDKWCAFCGTTQALDVQHRAARGMGGTQRPEVAFALSNLITLCRRHHMHVEQNPDWARRFGYRLDNGQGAAEARVWRNGRWVLLGDDGGVATLEDVETEAG